MNPDIVVMDVQMPQMNGFEAFGTILVPTHRQRSF
ncbi:MAG: hypothetical protein CL726_05895 [Chloroflexi bacterium]|jgi:CheY-like chemotaxis protein|nr:hypothetical protein [Chloroflexota bacterium]|tara:strand:+ start:28022 stop:28126 length:105 start_codon:yes stop_codon:yes gene_type:complete